MLKKGLGIVVSLLVVAGVTGFALYKMNLAPVAPAVSLQQVADVRRPYVVKLHAQWCPICMATKGVWSDLQGTYAGRVNLVVFDLTTNESTEASRAEAKRLGLDAFFAAHGEEPGAIFVLDGASKEVKGTFRGSRQVAEYKAAIENAMRG